MTESPVFVRAVLAIGVLALLYNAYVYTGVLLPGGRPVSQTERALEEAGATDPAPPVQEARATPIARPALARYVRALAKESRNPFLFGQAGLPNGAGGETDADRVPTLEGILIGEGRRIALIDGRARSEGETIDGSLIKRIEVDRVVVQRGSKEIELRPPD